MLHYQALKAAGVDVSYRQVGNPVVCSAMRRRLHVKN